MTERDDNPGTHRFPVYGFRPDPQHVETAARILQDEGHGTHAVGAYLEACLRGLAEDSRNALAFAAPRWPSRARHERLAETLRRRIDNGELRGRMPPAVTLADDYGVYRGTASKALAILERDGVIAAAHGRPDGRRGYEVVRPPAETGFETSV